MKNKKQTVLELGVILLLIFFAVFLILYGCSHAPCFIIICFWICILIILHQQKRYTNVLNKIAFNDELCGCPNLTKFKYDIQQYIDNHPDKKLLMVKLDIKEFKLLNNIFGQKIGNTVLIEIANVLRQVKDPGYFCRAHDDEFYIALICENFKGLDGIKNKFMEQFYEKMGGDFTYQLKVVAGLYFMSFENCVNAEEAIEKAGIAHSRAKESELEICIYDEELVCKSLWNKEVENWMPAALAHSEFKLYLQAQYNLKDNTVPSAEALVRWERNGDVILPADFIPILEHNGLIIKLDFYMFEQACKTLRKWIDEGISPIEIAVNFSRKHLANSEFVQNLCEIADEYCIPHYLLVVELTETTIWENEKMMIEMVDSLHASGFLVAMDDFGTGYSSLGLLKNLPVDIMKIDRSFFINNRYKTRARLLILNMMNMAKQLGMVTVAEGVEDQEHIDFLSKVGCDKVQSYYFEKPVPAEDFRIGKKKMQTPEIHIDAPLFFPIGDIRIGRGELGEEMPVKIYRLFLFSLREALVKKYGEGEMIDAYRAGGCIAGRRFAREYLDLTLSEDKFFHQLQLVLYREKIGDIKIENRIENWKQMIITVANDLDCSGIKDEGKTLCQYDEGFFSGILYEYNQRIYSVSEIDCWANGAASCRFLIRLNE